MFKFDYSRAYPRIIITYQNQTIWWAPFDETCILRAHRSDDFTGYINSPAPGGVFCLSWSPTHITIDVGRYEYGRKSEVRVEIPVTLANLIELRDVLDQWKNLIAEAADIWDR